MKKFSEILEKLLMPIASKMATQRHFKSVRDGFVAILPITLTGSMAVLINVFIEDMPNQILGEGNPITTNLDWLIEICNFVQWGTLSMMALLFTVTLGYSLAKNSGINPLSGAVVAISVLVVTIPETVIDGGSYVHDSYLGATGLFTALIMVMLSLEVFIFALRKKITIKMPEQVPANVALAFTSFIPAMMAIFFSAAISFVVFTVSGFSINDLISEYLMKPLLNLSQGYMAVITINFFTQLLWFFGIHGMQVFSAIYESIWRVAEVQNVEAYAAGLEVPYMWVRASFDLYGIIGGSGATLGFIIAMFAFGRRPETKALSRLSIAPGVFNINEPIIFGVPIVLNPIYFIPWIFVPMITLSIGYFATYIGFAGPVVVAVPWPTPVILSAFLATAGSIGAVITQVICVAVGIAIWSVFLIIAEKQADKEYKGENIET